MLALPCPRPRPNALAGPATADIVVLTVADILMTELDVAKHELPA